MSVQELQAAVSTLSFQELSAFHTWFDEFAADAWDRQIEEDMKSGKLDALYDGLQEEAERGELRPLDEVINNPRLS